MVLDLVFSSLHPAVVVFIVGASVSIIMSLINKKFLGSEAAQEVKKRMQEIRAIMLDAQKCGDMKKVNECLRELMKINSEYLRFMIKPMLISLVLFMMIVPALRGNFTGKTIATVPKTIPGIGGMELSWFWWYAICAFVVSTIVRKILGI